jgi:hypothetical protein
MPLAELSGPRAAHAANRTHPEAAHPPLVERPSAFA